MAYLITATNENGAVSVQRDTAVAALEQATLMTQRGMMDVLITDPKGQLYPPAEFERLFVQDRGAAGVAE